MVSSHKKLIEVIVERASTIQERLSDNFVPDNYQQDDPLIKTRLDLWCKASAEGDWEKFRENLILKGIDLNVVYPVLGKVHLKENYKLPKWAKLLDECLETISSFNKEKIEQELLEGKRYLDSKQPIAFEEVFIPFIHVATRDLRDKIGSYYDLLSDSAHASLERSLLWWLSEVCQRVLEREFFLFQVKKQSSLIRLLKKSKNEVSRIHYKKFIKELLLGGLLTFFEEYPVLARLVSTGLIFWIDSITEFLSRLTVDRPEIERIFNLNPPLGQVIAIQTNLSDRHNNGRSIMSITFSSGFKLLYKTKNLGIENAYFSFLLWLNQHEALLPFKVIKVIERSTYGWVEFVENLPCTNKEEVQNYYHRSGMLLCLAYVLAGTDLHAGNIIACGEHPVLIDLETLLHPHFPEDKHSIVAENAITVAQKILFDSVLSTGLLPRWYRSWLNDNSYDYTGLGGGYHNETPIRLPIWSNINTDTMFLEFKYLNTPITANVPFLEDKTIHLRDYHEEIIEGFQKMYYFVMEKRGEIKAKNGPLANFNKKKVRFIFRATRVYDLVLKKALKPEFLRDGAERSIQLDILDRRLKVISSETSKNMLLFDAEQQALEQMDIPHFTACSSSCSLLIDEQQKIDNYFPETSLNIVIARLNQLNAEDLERQIGIIRGSLYSHDVSDAYPSLLLENSQFEVESFTLNTVIEQVTEIATLLQKRAIWAVDGTVTWISPQYNYEIQRFQLETMGYSLYQGSCGVALFLAALERVTGIGLRHISLAALQPLQQDLLSPNFDKIVKQVGLGGAVGIGSIIYALVRTSQFLNEPMLLESARKAASTITPDFISADEKLDIISGAAGAILGLLTLYGISNEPNILAQARFCGHHLLTQRVVSKTGYRTWAVEDEKLLTGFSHGAAGIAYALLRLYQVTNEIAFLEAAQEAISYERSVFRHEVNNWPDFRIKSSKDGFTCLCSWCHGAPGIGLARVGGLDILDTPEIRRDIEAAIKTTKQQKLGQLDHLCCGNLGRVEFLFTAAQKLSQPQLLETAREQAAQVLARAKHRRSFAYASSLSFNPGFFQGASGIGYELLRLAYPNQLPSVLLWE
jgi:type 2 lantibiotic biosynthesis protein LanM